MAIDRAKAGDLQELIKLVGGQFIEDMPSISRDFDDWKDAFQARLDRDIGSLLAASDQGDVAREIGRRVTNTGTGLYAVLSDISPSLAPATFQGDGTVASMKRTLPFIGRRTEVKFITGLWNSAQAGRGEIVLVTGMPGSGKTRLLEEIQEIVRPNAQSFVSCYETERQVGLSPVIDLLQTVISNHTLDALPKPYSAVLAEISPQFNNGDRPAPQLGNLASERRLFEAIITAFGVEAKAHPLALIIDDLQWADPSTLAFLNILTRRISDLPIMFVGAARNLRRANRVRKLGLPEIQLGPLESEDLELLKAHLPGLPLKRLSVESLARATGGNAFLISEYVKQLTLENRPGGTIRKLAVRRQSVDDFVNSSLNDLPRAARRVLSTLAVFGRPISPKLLRAAAGVSNSAFATALDQLVTRDVIIANPQIAFRHDLFRQSVYNRIPAFTRRHLHFRAATTWRSTPTPEGRIAHHLFHAQQFTQAHKFAIRASQDADKRYAYREARALARLALKTTRDRSVKARLHADLAHRYFRAMLFKRCAPHLKHALGRYSTYLKDVELVKLNLLEIEMLISLGGISHADVTRRTHELQREFANAIDIQLKYELLRLRMRATGVAGRADEAQEIVDQLMHLAEQGAGTTSIKALSTAARIESYTQSAQHALPWATKAESLAMTIEDAEARCEVLTNVVAVYYEAGHYRAALKLCDEAIARFHEAGALNSWQDVSTHKHMLLVESGDYASARAVADDMLSCLGGNDRGLSTLHANIAVMEFDLDNFKASETHARTCLYHAERYKMHLHRLSAHAIIGLNLLETGRLNEAMQHASFIEEQLNTIGYRVGDFSFVAIFIARTNLRIGHNDMAICSLEEAIDDCKERDASGHLRMKLELANIIRKRDRSQARSLCAEIKVRAAECGMIPIVNRAENLLVRLG